MSDTKTIVTAIQGVPVSSTQPTTGQVLQFDGVEYVPTTLPTFFSPTNISGLQLWLRADLGVTLNGSQVSQWNDQSNIGDTNRNVFQTTSGQQPTLNAVDAYYNNQSTLSFASASNQVLQSGAWSPAISEPYTIFIIGNDDGSEIAQDWLAASSNPGPVMQDNGTGYYWSLYNGTNLDGPSGGADNAPLVFAAAFNGSSSTISISTFTPYATGSLGTPIQLGALGVWLGSAGEYPHYLNGKIAEVIVYDSVLSPMNLCNILTYIEGRYSITIGS